MTQTGVRACGLMAQACTSRSIRCTRLSTRKPHSSHPPGHTSRSLGFAVQPPGRLGSVHYPASMHSRLWLTQWSAHYRPVELAKLPRILVDEAAPAPLRAGLLRNEWLISAMAIIGVCAHRCARACAHIAHARTHRSRVYALFLKIAASQCTHARKHARTHAHHLVTCP